jgi:hypothetical protein
MKNTKQETATLDLVSIARLSCSMQKSVPTVRRALEELEVPVHLRLNGIDHFRAEVADRLYELLLKNK